MKILHIIKRGFTLVEILGAMSVVAVVATISLTSVKDSIAAGERATAQRILQSLNTALQNYKSVGGCIPEYATAGMALDYLMVGTNIGTENFAPLVSAPPLTLKISGADYNLDYGHDVGFVYVADSSMYAAAGQEVTAEAAGTGEPSYMFDITSAAEVSQGLQAFLDMNSADDAYQTYLESFNAAIQLGNLNAADLSVLNTALAGEGLASVNGLWQVPSFDITDPAEVSLALEDLRPTRWETSETSDEYQLHLASLIAAMNRSIDTGNTGMTSQINTALLGEFLFNVGLVERTNINADWSDLNFAGVNLSGRNLSGIVTLSGGQLNATTGVSAANLSNLNLTGLNLSGRNLFHVNFTNATGLTGSNFNAASNLTSVTLGGINMSGFNAFGKNLSNVNFSFANNLTGTMLNTAANLQGASFAGINLTGLSGRTNQPGNVSGWRLFHNADFSGANVTGTQLNALWYHNGANFAGLNMNGFNPSNRQLTGNNLVGTTGLTGTQLRSAWVLAGSGVTGQPTNLSGMNLTGLGGWNKELRNVDMSNSFGFTGTHLNSATNITGANFSGMNLTGWNPTGKNLRYVKLANVVGVTGAGLNAATNVMYSNLSNLNLSGFNTVGKNLNGVALNNVTGLTGANLTDASSFQGVSLSGFNAAGLNVAGKSVQQVTFSGASNLSSNFGSQLNAATNINQINVAGVNLAGFSAAGKNVSWSNYAGATGITGVNLNGASNYSRADFSGMDLSGLNISGQNIWGMNLSNSVVSVNQLSGALKGALGNSNYHMDLRGTGITRAQMLQAGWTDDQLTWVRF